MSKKILELLLKNKNWASEKKKSDTNFFKELSQKQNPSIFWLGCSDSRVIPKEICDFSLGEMFMHTNIANQANMNDLNLTSSLDYAINTLKVKHIIVCGHTQCGGVQAAIDGNTLDTVSQWITPLRELYKKNKNLNSEDLSELNVKKQAKKIATSELTQNSWKKRNLPQIHGWIFQIESGLIKEICFHSPN